MKFNPADLADHLEAQKEGRNSIEVMMPPPSQISSPRESKSTRLLNTPALLIIDSVIRLPTMLQWKMKVFATVKRRKLLKN